MKTISMKRKIIQVVGISVLTLLFSAAANLQAQEQPAPANEQAPLSKNLLGTWVLVGVPGKVGEIPASGGRFKFLTGRHWTITQADPKTGVTIFHHGGTYTLKGDEYAESVEYANPNTKELIKQTFKFTTKVEDDTLTLTGIGNPFNEVWKRVK